MKTLAVSLIVLLAACNKENQPAIHQQSPPQMKLARINASVSEQAANPSNPYDSIGSIHNKVLQKVCDYVDETGDTSISGRREQVNNYFKNRYGEDISKKLLEMESRSKKDFPGGMIKAVPQNMFSTVVESYLNRIINAVRSVKTMDGYQAFKATVVSIEKEVPADKRLSKAEQQKMFLAASIARYSVSFWMGKAAIKPEDQTLSTMGFFGNVWRAINVGLSDVSGAVSGMGYSESIREILEDASDMSGLASAFL